MNYPISLKTKNALLHPVMENVTVKPDVLSRVYNFISRYRIVHILFWIWFAWDLAHTRQAQFNITFIEDLPDIIAIVGTQMAAVYFTAYYLAPKYLDARKYVLFVLYYILVILSSVILHTLFLELYTFITVGKFYKNFLVVGLSHLWDTIFNCTVLVAVITYSARTKIAERNRLLEKEKVESELKFLRSQINPHFLFNALNSINVLIDIDKQKASEALTKFSSLLRYNLYETKDSRVLIQTEINYLKDYIEIEKIRVGKIVTVNLSISQASHHFQIAPFLLVPFIENAFKHVTRNKNQQNFINIHIEIKPDYVECVTENSFETSLFESEKKHGIGLENVKRRLTLLYPSRHSLEIEAQNQVYRTKLRIYAYKDELPDS